MLRLIVFDCDGVLFESREANRAYYDHLLARFGCPPMDEEDLAYVHTHNVMDSVAHIFRRYPEVSREAVHRYRTELDYTPFLRYMVMEPDLLEFLEIVRPHFHTAISTNRTTTMPAILELFGLEPYFDMVVTALDAGRPKPAPDGMVKILERFGATPEETLYIGDSEVDRAHVAPLGVPLVAFKNPELQADYHVGSFMEILRLPPLSSFRRALEGPGDGGGP